MKKNKFSKALKHIKKDLTEVAPTNSMSSVYSKNDPGFSLQQISAPKRFLPDVDGNFPSGIPGNAGDSSYVRPAGIWTGEVDWDTVTQPNFGNSRVGDDGTNTSTLIDESTGTVLTALPPNSRSFILGPLVDGFVYNHLSDAYTKIGYIQKDTRQFVLLAQITGTWSANWPTDSTGNYSGTNFNVWNGTSTGFTAYNSSFTLAMAQWMRTEILAGRFMKNVSYFQSGGIAQPQLPAGDGLPGGMYGGGGVGAGAGDASGDGGIGDGYGSGGEPDIGTKQGDPNHGGWDPNDPPNAKDDEKDKDKDEDEKQKLLDQIAELNKQSKDLADDLNRRGVGQSQAMVGAIALAPWAWNAIVTAGLSVAALQAIISSYNASDYVYQSTDIDNWPDSGLSDEEWEAQAQQGRERDAQAAKDANDRSQAAQDELAAAKESGNQDRVDRAEEEYSNAEKNQERVRSNNIRNRKARTKARRERYGTSDNTTGMFNSYKPQGKVLSESRTRQLREIKKPYVVQEQPVQKLKNYKPNFKGKFSPQNTPDKTASKESDALVMSGNQKGQAWRTADKYWSGYETQERMNVISDRVGHGQMAWDMIIDEARKKNGWKNREIQEQLNQIAHDKAMKDLHSNYESPFGYVIHEQGASTEEELDTVMKDPLVKKVAKRLRTQIDYKDKPSRKGFPDKPPAQQVDGWHPEYGKKYKYDKLDSVSAVAMRNAPTGDSEIDANVKKAARKPKVKWQESTDWRSEIEINNSESLIEVENLDDFYERKQKLNERMTTSSIFSYSLEGSSADHVVMQTGFTGDGDINDFDINTGSHGGGDFQMGDHRGGEFTAMTNFTDMVDVDDPTGQFGKSVRGFRGVDENGDPDLSPTTSEHPNGTSDGDDLQWPGSTGGFRGVSMRGSYNSSPWTATGGPTNENAVGFEEQEEPQQGILARGIGGAIIFGSTGNPGVPRLAALKAVDTSEMDTFSMNWFTMGHIFVDHVSSSPTYNQTFTRDDFRPTSKGDDIVLFYWCGDKEGAQSYGEPMSSYGSKHQDGWRPINRKPDGTLVDSVDPAIIPWKPNPVDENGDRIARGGQYAGPYRGNTFYNAKVHLPEWCRAKNQRFLIVQNQINGGGYAYSRFGITSIRFQRRTSMTVVAPLDSPEATAFIRDGSLGKEETTPQKRKKRVDDLLKSSKQYVNKVVSDPFPGTDTKIGEAQGTSGNKYVPQAWDNKKQEFADAGTLDQQKDKFVSKDVKLPPNYSEVQKAKKKK